MFDYQGIVAGLLMGAMAFGWILASVHSNKP